MDLTKNINLIFGNGDISQTKIVATVLVIVVLWLLRSILLHLVFRNVKHVRQRYSWRKGSGYALFFLIILVVGRIWFEGFQSLATFVGLVSAAMTIALKDLVVNVAGWAFLVIRRPFEVGDRVQIGETTGDVIDLRIFQFTVMEVGNWVDAEQSTGRVIHIPNGMVFTHPQANYNKGFRYIWNEVPVLLTFESNWKKAKEILLDIAKKYGEEVSKHAQDTLQEATRKYLISYSKLGPTVYTSVKDSGVLLTIRHLCDPKNRRGIQNKIWEDVLEAFSKHPDIDFAYPTQRFFNNTMESKEAMQINHEINKEVVSD